MFVVCCLFIVCLFIVCLLNVCIEFCFIDTDNRNNSEGKEGSDPVRFGEVANEPPRLDDDPSSLKKRKGKGNNTSNKKKNAATDEEKNAMEKERLRVIEAYRQIKMRKMRG
eukprot:m.16517 g.16517  ORF g.16517 m.16517 type:complete len:111 (+) comp8012_c0_seq1:1-333(+)